MNIAPSYSNTGISNSLTSFYQTAPSNKSELSHSSFKSSDSNRSKRLLIVDDEKAVLSSLKRLFKFHGFTVHLAEGAMAGLDILRQHPVDAIISDLRMPEVKGDQFLSETVDLGPEIPRIILTGLTDQIPRLKDKDYQKVIDAYVEKPWSNNKLVNLVNESIAKKQTTQDLAKPLIESTVQLSESAIHLSHFQNRLATDTEVDEDRVELFKALIDSGNYKIDAVSTSKAMLNFNELLS